MPGAQCTRSLVCEVVVQDAHEYSQRSHRKSPGIPARNGFTAYFVLSPAIGYQMHISLLRRLPKTDSLEVVGLGEGCLCRWKLDWDDLAIVAWKKGGVVACGPCSTSRPLHSTPCGQPSPGGSVHAFSAQ